MFSKADLLIKRLFCTGVVAPFLIMVVTLFVTPVFADDSAQSDDFDWGGYFDLFGGSGLADADTKEGGLSDGRMPIRALDHRYGMALYEFYQQNYYQALTELAIATKDQSARASGASDSPQLEGSAESTRSAKSSSEGPDNRHGYQPELMKGAMYLSFGLQNDAKQTFEAMLLSDEDDTTGIWSLDFLTKDPEVFSDQTQSLIWFYLGKTFYQLKQKDVAYVSLERVDIDQLEQYQAEMMDEKHATPHNSLIDANVLDEYHHMMGELYLGRGNVELARFHLEEINTDSPWSNYLGYNLALSLKAQGLGADSQEILDTIIERNEETLELEDDEIGSPEAMRDQRERKAITDRVYLTQGAGFMAESQFREAMDPLEKISLQGPLSDQALFTYGVAATKAQDFSLAMGAIQALLRKQSVNPVIYESYFAMGYLYEQMNKKTEALAAYKLAASYYSAVLKELEADLSHSGKNHLLNRYFTDQPANEMIANLFSKAHYQLAVAHVRELETLENSFAQWLKKIDSFEVMVETRKLARDQRVLATREKLESPEVKDIVLQRGELADALKEQSNAQSFYFFLNREEKDNLRRINKVKLNVETYKKQLLELDKSTSDYDDYLKRIERVERYFYWRASEAFPIKRWDAQSNLNSLDRELAELSDRKSQLGALVKRSEQIEVLEQRIAEIKPRLLLLSEQANSTLLAARVELSGLIAGELKTQAERVGQFLAQASIAQARLSDEMLEARSYE